MSAFNFWNKCWHRLQALFDDCLCSAFYSSEYSVCYLCLILLSRRLYLHAAPTSLWIARGYSATPKFKIRFFGYAGNCFTIYVASFRCIRYLTNRSFPVMPLFVICVAARHRCFHITYWTRPATVHECHVETVLQQVCIVSLYGHCVRAWTDPLS